MNTFVKLLNTFANTLTTMLLFFYIIAINFLYIIIILGKSGIERNWGHGKKINEFGHETFELFFF